APYDWLFPRACCVIHHGGSGTLSAVLRAGKPSILLPQIVCQELFAAMLARERLSAGQLPSGSLTAEALTPAIPPALTDPQLYSQALAWQQIVSRDGGVKEAGDLVEEHARRYGAAGGR